MSFDYDKFYAFASLLGVFGVFPLARRLARASNPNHLEIRIKWILYCIMFYFVSRIPFLAYWNDLAGRLTYVSAVLLGFATFLYFETLYRRHMPFWLKVATVALNAFFIFDALFLDMAFNQRDLLAFGVYQLLLHFTTIVLGLTRNRKDYAQFENTLINFSLISLVLGSLFFLSDLRAFYETFGSPRFAVLGALLFVYIAIEAKAESRKKIGTYVLRTTSVTCFAIFLTASVSLFIPVAEAYPHLVIFFLCAILTLCITTSVASMDADKDFHLFVRQILETDKKSQQSFLKGVKEIYKDVQLRRLLPTDLDPYSVPEIDAYFVAAGTHLLSVFELRDALELVEDRKSAEVIEQMIDLLEKLEMSHLLRINEGTYVVFSYYVIGQSNVINTQTSLICQIAKLIK